MASPKTRDTDSVGSVHAEKISRSKLLVMQELKDMHNNVLVYLQITAVTVWIIIGIAMIVMGGLYKDDCLIQPFIPIYLLMTGLAHILISSILLLRILRCLSFVFLDTVIFAFISFWFVAGSFWIFSKFDQKEGKCATNLYLFAYGTLTFDWITLWLACLCYYCCNQPESLV